MPGSCRDAGTGVKECAHARGFTRMFQRGGQPHIGADASVGPIGARGHAHRVAAYRECGLAGFSLQRRGRDPGRWCGVAVARHVGCLKRPT